jgi:hypothetical protein
MQKHLEEDERVHKWGDPCQLLEDIPDGNAPRHLNYQNIERNRLGLLSFDETSFHRCDRAEQIESDLKNISLLLLSPCLRTSCLRPVHTTVAARFGSAKHDERSFPAISATSTRHTTADYGKTLERSCNALHSLGTHPLQSFFPIPTFQLY